MRDQCEGAEGALATWIALLTILITSSAVGAQVEIRDSLGVEIIETEGSYARLPSPITVRSEPALQIGLLDGDPAYLFSSVSGVELMPGPVVAVLDRGSAQLRLYNGVGRIIGRRGRPVIVVVGVV